MDHTTRGADLLDHLASLARCSYLSDLHQNEFHDALLQALEQTPAEAFSDREWRAAVRYLTGQDVEDDAPALRRQLFDWLNSPLDNSPPQWYTDLCSMALTEKKPHGGAQRGAQMVEVSRDTRRQYHS